MHKEVNAESIISWVCESPQRVVASNTGDTIKRPIVLAVVGLSDKPNRPSFGVSQAMQQMGYRIIPVNPGAEMILGERCYPDLASVPAPVDVVQVFRRAEYTPPVANEVAQEAERLGIRVLWLQEGIANNEAAAIAHDAGVQVVMDRCLYKEAVRVRREPQ